MTAFPRAPRQLALFFGSHRCPHLSPGTLAAVLHYARVAPWLDPRDIEHEAILATLEARARGIQISSLVVARILLRYVAEAGAPVHVPGHMGKAGSRARRYYEQATSCERTPVVVTRATGHHHDHPDVAAVAASQWRPLEDRLDDARAMVEVRRLLDAETEAARLVLLEQEKPAVVAERMRLPRAEVYQQTASAVRRLRAAFVRMEVEA
jgi:hypothetical protein